MHLLISPAKTLDMNFDSPMSKVTNSPFNEESNLLINELKKLSATEIQNLMSVSSKIAELNAERFANWSLPFNEANSKAAVFAFKGDVYTGLEAESLSNTDLEFAQNHLSILSGLYGLLRPMDLMQAYRLEMGTKFANKSGKNLYEFWGNKITDEINKREKDYIINLASNEYFKAVNKKALNAEIINPVFKDEKNGTLKIISFYAKKARGMMTRFIIQNRIKNVEEIKNFNLGGYAFSENLSNTKEWIFTR
ncbi:MAG: peroxide stress protein YaaA [Flavobacteriales bacterium]|nr:peroxide stress protein YaaA [Flavobacteriales bacterium]